MLLEGNSHKDKRGVITFNNEFDASQIKRIYTIENYSAEFIRGWQGHKIEQRWFAAMKGQFVISIIKIDNFDNPSRDLMIYQYEISDQTLTYLHVPAGCITAIQAKEANCKLMVLSDYAMGAIDDEYRFELDYFNRR